MADSTDTDSANATILAAEEASVAVNSSSVATSGSYAQLMLSGWTQITQVALPQTAADHHYVGAAFYKVINGVTEVIVANQGSEGLYDFAVSDTTIALNGTPQADSDALAYYNDVVAWVTNNLPGPVNVIETGHSLGGQEADFVEVSLANTPSTEIVATEAISFDAPGQSTSMVQSGVTYNALNISLVTEGVHVAGSALNTGYLGGSVTINGGVNGAVVGVTAAAAINPVVGLLGWFLTSFVYDHVTTRLASYFSEHPALGGVNLQTYALTKLTQTVVTALAGIKAQDYNSSSDPAMLISNIVNPPPASASTSSSTSTAETFTETSTANGFVLQGSQGDSITATISGTQETLTDNTGAKVVLNFNSAGTALVGYTTSYGDPTTSATSFAADGSSTTTTTYASGAYATVIDDGQGNITTDYYTKNGIETSSTWVHSDGTSGTTDQYAELLANYGGFDLGLVSSKTVIQNADGTYTTQASGSIDITTTTSFTASGTQTGQSTTSGALANNLTTVNSSPPTYSAGAEFTYNINSSAHIVGDSWYSANENGTANPNGINVSWAMTAPGSTTGSYCTQGTDAIDPSGMNVSNDTALDGSVYRLTDDQWNQGDTVSHYDAGGALLSDWWADTNYGAPKPSVTGSDTFSDGSGSGTFTDTRDGSSGTVTLNGTGGISIVNNDANGTKTSTDTWNGDGTYTITMFNADGSQQATYDYLANGNVTVTDMAPDGSIADQQTVAAGLVVNPDGSNFSKVANTDGSYTVYYEDAQGDITGYQYSAAGTLTGSYHAVSSNTSSGSWVGTLTNGTSWTSLYNYYTPTYTDAQGNAWTIYQNAAQIETGADYVNAAAGTHGSVTYGANSSVYEIDYAKDGSSVSHYNDGQSDLETDFFDANGNETSDTWQDADGNSGGDTYNADGSYSIYTTNGAGLHDTSNYNSAGVLTGTTVQSLDASGDLVTNSFDPNGNALGSTVQTTNAAGELVITSYDASGNGLGSTVQTTSASGNVTTTSFSGLNGTGTALSDTWINPDGSSGSDTYDSAGSLSSSTVSDGQGTETTTAFNPQGLVTLVTTQVPLSNGAYNVITNDLQGDVDVKSYAASGQETSDVWQKSDGSTGTTIYGAQGSVGVAQSSTVQNANGSTTTMSADGQGNMNTTVTSALGVKLSDSWTHADGSQGQDTFNPDGSSLGNTLNADGSSSRYTTSASTGYTTTSKYDQAGALTEQIVTQPGVAAPLSDTTYNADGSHTTVLNTAGVGTSTTHYASNGNVLSDTWSHADGSFGSDAHSADGSSSSTDHAANGYYTVTTTDTSGNSTTVHYDPTGVGLWESVQSANGTTSRVSLSPASSSGSAYSDFLKDGQYSVGLSGTDASGNPIDTYQVISGTGQELLSLTGDAPVDAYGVLWEGINGAPSPSSVRTLIRVVPNGSVLHTDDAAVSAFLPGGGEVDLSPGDANSGLSNVVASADGVTASFQNQQLSLTDGSTTLQPWSGVPSYTYAEQAELDAGAIISTWVASHPAPTPIVSAPTVIYTSVEFSLASLGANVVGVEAPPNTTIEADPDKPGYVIETTTTVVPAPAPLPSPPQTWTTRYLTYTYATADSGSETDTYAFQLGSGGGYSAPVLASAVYTGPDGATVTKGANGLITEQFADGYQLATNNQNYWQIAGGSGPVLTVNGSAYQ